MWRKILNAKYKKGADKFLPANIKSHSMSWIWKDITKPLDPRLITTDPFISNLVFKVGDGSVLEFWEDNWVGMSCLQVLFPRLYTLSTKKRGKITEFGVWSGEKWEWKIPLRIVLFDQEVGMWNEFMRILGERRFGLYPKDCQQWAKSTSGCYSPKEMTK
ncbi:hypothetical protein V6N11_082784 [Hibiscus sabdariffa]|uniref:Reverse transcriptase zinc-binding domain-containing protein n=1 Tax=Hibiscus sabdariffa TaxID=183260 RepID=A0ABR2QJX1_9ROSI